MFFRISFLKISPATISMYQNIAREFFNSCINKIKRSVANFWCQWKIYTPFSLNCSKMIHKYNIAPLITMNPVKKWTTSLSLLYSFMLFVFYCQCILIAHVKRCLITTQIFLLRTVTDLSSHSSVNKWTVLIRVGVKSNESVNFIF